MQSMGFTRGNNFWLGSKQSCHELNNPPKITLKYVPTRIMQLNVTDVKSVVPVVYRMFYLSHKSTIQFDLDFFDLSKIIHLGLCLPLTCDHHDAEIFGEKIFPSTTFNEKNIFGDVKFLKSKVLELRKNFWNEPFSMSML
jgi:hypothetical protein